MPDGERHTVAGRSAVEHHRLLDVLAEYLPLDVHAAETGAAQICTGRRPAGGDPKQLDSELGMRGGVGQLHDGVAVAWHEFDRGAGGCRGVAEAARSVAGLVGE